MNIDFQIKEIVKQIMKDPSLKEKFEKNPGSVIETFVGSELPGGEFQQVLSGVKAKLARKEDGGLLGKLKKVLK